MLTNRQINEAYAAQEALKMLELTSRHDIGGDIIDGRRLIVQSLLDNIKADNGKMIRDLTESYLTTISATDALNDEVLTATPSSFHEIMFKVFVSILTPTKYKLNGITNTGYDEPKEYLAKGLLTEVN